MESKIKNKVDSLIENKAFAVIRLDDSKKALPLVEALIEGGVKNIEITLTSQNALEIIKETSKEFADSAIIGVGSVLEKDTMLASIDAGATYVVTPILNISLIDICHNYDYPIFTGAYSPTEIYTATKAGADVVKVFPANIVGIDYFKAIKAPMPNLKIMPTGGVSLTNAAQWFAAGACAVGVGGSLLNKKDINENNFQKIKDNAKLLMSGINEYFGKI